MATQTETKTHVQEALDVPWNVVVHDDPVNLQQYVVMVFKKLFGYDESRARHHMLEVHLAGKSIVWSGTREKAEFFVSQLHAHQLTATLEKSS